MATQRLLPNRRVLRYTYGERVMHWIAGLTYVYLLLTGLAFYSPYLYWLAQVLGGGSFSRAVHPWVGVVYTAVMLWMYKEWAADMRPTPGDRAWKENMRAYIRNEDEHVPPVGRFNPGQKQFFWVMFWSTIALLVSGIGLWFIGSIPWSLVWLRYLAILVHVVAALITIGAFIIHVYMGTAVVREGFTSVVRGEVSEDWARTHHPLWLAQVRGEPAPKK